MADLWEIPGRVAPGDPPPWPPECQYIETHKSGFTYGQHVYYDRERICRFVL